ncbi:MAG: N-acetylmuramoyl-L-alanine amidase [Nitrospirae bacterium]|nr:N-acetylmuramoyl-L-alanine amidase [Nitrospirota bacterium]
MRRLQVVSLVAVCLLLLVQAAAGANAKNEIKDVRVFSSKQYTRVVIDLLTTPVFKEGAIPDAKKIYFDLQDAVLRATSVKSKDVSNAVIKKVRLGQFDATTVRIVFDLDNYTQHRVFTLTDPNRIIIDVYAAKEQTEPLPAESKSGVEETSAKKDQPLIKEKTKAKEKTEPLPFEAKPGTDGTVAKKDQPLVKEKTKTKEKTEPLPFEAKPGTEETSAKRDQPLVKEKTKTGEKVKSEQKAKPEEKAKAEEKVKSEPKTTDEDVAKIEEKVKAELKSKLEEKPKKSDKVKTASQKHSDKPKTSVKDKGKKGKDSDIAVQEIEKKVESETFTRKKIVIDPGHGGHDTGAIGVTGLQEKDVVLEVAKKTATILKEKYMYDVTLTRDDDTFISLDERAAIANGKNADLFVSIHGNANNSPSVRGLETYFLNFSNSEESMKVAARENDISVKRMKEVQSELGLILASLARETKRDESLRLAHYLQNSLYTYLRKKHKDIVDHGVRQALFYVLVGANMPSALVEISYLTNPDEEKRLKTDQYKDEIAASLAAGINKYMTSLPGAPEYAKAAGAKKRLN